MNTQVNTASRIHPSTYRYRAQGQGSPGNTEMILMEKKQIVSKPEEEASQKRDPRGNKTSQGGHEGSMKACTRSYFLWAPIVT